MMKYHSIIGKRDILQMISQNINLETTQRLKEKTTNEERKIEKDGYFDVIGNIQKSKIPQITM